MNRLVESFNPMPNECIIEIGPGTGRLTSALLERISSLTVIELDRDLARRLQKRYPAEQVRVIQADILKVKLADLGGSHFRLIGNLPYNISTPLIFHLLDQIESIQDMQFMLQREVALRLAARHIDKNYGRLSVMTAMAIDCQLLFDVPAQAFDPPPKVQSMVLHLRPKEYPLTVANPEIFKVVVTTAFGQRRKTLRNSLKAVAQNKHFVLASIDPGLRAEAISVEQYIALADAIASETT